MSTALAVFVGILLGLMVLCIGLCGGYIFYHVYLIISERWKR